MIRLPLAPAARLVPVCEIADLPVGLGRPFRVGDVSLAIFRTRAGKVFAVAGSCPHRGAPLADGMLSGESVVCPFHAYRFQADTGECDQQGACDVATYPVVVERGTISVGIPG